MQDETFCVICLTWFSEYVPEVEYRQFCWSVFNKNARGGSRTAAISKMERFVIIVNGFQLPAVNYYHKALHLGCCSSPRSASSYCSTVESDRFRCRRSEVLYGKSIHKSFVKFIRKHLCRSLFLIKLQASNLNKILAEKFYCRFFQISRDQVSLQNNSG